MFNWTISQYIDENYMRNVKTFDKKSNELFKISLINFKIYHNKMFIYSPESWMETHDVVDCRKKCIEVSGCVCFNAIFKSNKTLVYCQFFHTEHYNYEETHLIGANKVDFYVPHVSLTYVPKSWRYVLNHHKFSKANF